MASAFKSSVGRLNLKILKYHYYCVKIQQKWLHKNATLKKKFSNWNTLGCFTSIKSENITFVHILKFLKNFFFFPPHFLRNSFVLRINRWSQKLLKIFSASKCAYLELSAGKNRESGGISVDTGRGNFCISMAPAFRSSVACQNLKILKNHYHCVKLQQKWLHKNAKEKKLFSKCYTLGCNICIKSEKITFGHIMKFLKFFCWAFPQIPKHPVV